MKKLLALILSAVLALMLVPFTAAADDRVVLTIADTTARSSRYDGSLGMWQYLAEKAGVEIRYIYLTPEEYAAGLSSGDLPDIVTTRNNLSTILENGAALDVGPYLEEYVPNFLKGETRRTLDVFRQLGSDDGAGQSGIQRRRIRQHHQHKGLCRPLGLL